MENRYEAHSIELDDGTLAWYIQDMHLGYCTDPMTKREAARRMRDLNKIADLFWKANPNG